MHYILHSIYAGHYKYLVQYTVYIYILILLYIYSTQHIACIQMYILYAIGCIKIRTFLIVNE